MTTHTNKIQNEAMYINLIIQTKKKQNYKWRGWNRLTKIKDSERQRVQNRKRDGKERKKAERETYKKEKRKKNI